MRRVRATWIAWIIVVLLTVVVSANQPPQTEDLELSTWIGTPTAFVVTATDPDIDCSDPTGHPLRFVLLVPPENGVVTGDLNDVLCSGQKNSIALCYTPGETFTGVDRFVIDILDPFDQRATSVVSIDVRQPAAEGSLSGDAAMSLTIDPLTPSFPAFLTDLALVYRYEGVTCEIRGSWKKMAGSTDDAFDDLKLLLRMPCSTVGSISGRVDFDPNASTPPFESAEIRGEMIVDLVWLTASLHLEPVQTLSFTTLSLSGPLPMGGSMSITTTLSDLCQCFEDATIRIRFPDLLCGVSGDATATFAQTGFEQAVLVIERIPVGKVLASDSWLSGAFNLTGTVESVITPSDVHAGVSLEWLPPVVVPDCVELLVDSFVSGGVWSGFQVYGLRVEGPVSEHVSVSSVTSLQPSDLATNARMTGFVDYWEVLALAGEINLCGECRGDWDISTYFGTTQSALFDWGMTRVGFRARRNADFELSSTLYFRSGDLGDPTVELVIGAVTHW